MSLKSFSKIYEHFIFQLTFDLIIFIFTQTLMALKFCSSLVLYMKQQYIVIIIYTHNDINNLFNLI